MDRSRSNRARPVATPSSSPSPAPAEDARFVALFPPLSAEQTQAFEWVIVVLTCCVAAACLAGAACAVPWARVKRWCCCCAGRGGAGAASSSSPALSQQRQQFNVLWGARVTMQLLAALYVLSLTVPLQIFWAPASPMRYGGSAMAEAVAAALRGQPAPALPPARQRLVAPTFPIPSVDTICRVSLGVSYGVLEPAFYLIVLFSCVYTLQRQGHEDGDDGEEDDDGAEARLYAPCSEEQQALFYSRQQRGAGGAGGEEDDEDDEEDDDEEEEEEGQAEQPDCLEASDRAATSALGPRRTDVEQVDGGQRPAATTATATTTTTTATSPRPSSAQRQRDSRKRMRRMRRERRSTDSGGGGGGAGAASAALDGQEDQAAARRGIAPTSAARRRAGDGRARKPSAVPRHLQHQPSRSPWLSAGDVESPPSFDKRQQQQQQQQQQHSHGKRGSGVSVGGSGSGAPPPSPHSAPLLSGPNVLVVSLAAGLTLPVAAAQAVAALFSRVITQLRYGESAMARFFAASVPVSAACTGVVLAGEREAGWGPLGGGGDGGQGGSGSAALPYPPVSPADCAACAFPVFSTIVSALFALLYSLWLVAAARRLGREALNARLRRRAAWGLGAALPALLCLGVALRGVSVLFFPYTLAHDATLLAYAATVCAAVVVASAVVVWQPLREARRAEKAAAAAAMNLPLLPLPLPSSSLAVDGEKQAV